MTTRQGVGHEPVWGFPKKGNHSMDGLSGRRSISHSLLRTSKVHLPTNSPTNQLNITDQRTAHPTPKIPNRKRSTFCNLHRGLPNRQLSQLPSPDPRIPLLDSSSVLSCQDPSEVPSGQQETTSGSEFGVPPKVAVQRPTKAHRASSEGTRLPM